MLFRRKLITNFIWIIAMITIVVIGAQYAFLYGIDFLFAGENNYLAELVSISYKALDVGLLIWIVIFLVVCIVLFLILRAIVQAIKAKHEAKPSTVGLIRILLVCAVFISAIIYRGSILISSGAVILSDSTFYDAAAGLFTDSAGIGDLAVHGASYIYLMLLNFVMQFLGDRVVAVVLLQIVIQILTIILVFAAFRRLVNFCTGFIAALSLTVLPLYTSKIFTSSPGCFVALLVVFAIYLISLFMTIKGGAFKIVSGLIIGLIIGYLTYMDILCAFALVVWFFALMYEIGDEERHKFLAGYLLLLLGVVIGLALSLCMDGGFDPDGIDIAVRTWVKVNTINIIPEYALIDPALGLSCLIQCMVMVGVGSWTILGTLGRDRVEYELPWILMFIFAITPMTRTGYLHDNVPALIVYLVLAGAGISALFAERAEEPDEEEEEVEDDESSEDEDNPANEVVFEALEEPETVSASEPAPGPAPAPASTEAPTHAPAPSQASAQAPTHTPSPAPAPASAPVPVTAVMDDDADFTDHKDGASDGHDNGLDKDNWAKKISPDDFDDVEFEKIDDDAEQEVLPTSISWASIKALDDEDNSPKEIEDIRDLLEDDIREEVYIPDQEPAHESGQDFEKESGSDVKTGHDAVKAAEEKPAYDPETTQVDDLPGMIPNPLPLPAKKKQSEMDYDLADDDFDDDEDDLDWDDLDGDDGDDDFDI